MAKAEGVLSAVGSANVKARAKFWRAAPSEALAKEGLDVWCRVPFRVSAEDVEVAFRSGSPDGWDPRFLGPGFFSSPRGERPRGLLFSPPPHPLARPPDRGHAPAVGGGKHPFFFKNTHYFYCWIGKTLSSQPNVLLIFVVVQPQNLRVLAICVVPPQCCGYGRAGHPAACAGAAAPARGRKTWVNAKRVRW